MVAFAVNSGLFANQNPPHYITNAYYLPIGYALNAGANTTVATRVYYFPITIWEAHAFSGASIYNTGAGDNGERIRLMIFRDNGASGGPGTLEKDFGEITLTAAAALRTLTSTWNALPGVYWGAVWTESVSGLSFMASYQNASGVGFGTGPNLLNYSGQITAPTDGTDFFMFSHHYVNTAYGAAPATAVAPTGTENIGVGAPGGKGGAPAFYLKG